MPATKVVLAGTPDSLRAAFRTWDEAKTNTRKADGQILIPVNEALAATNA